MMKTSSFSNLLMLCLVLLFSSCTCSNEKPVVEKTPEEKAAEKINEGVEKLTEGLGSAAKELEGGLAGALSQLEGVVEDLQEEGGVVKKKPLNFRKLAALIPDSAAGFKKIDNEGESTGVAGIKISKAKAVFEGNNKRIDLEIIDAGGVGMAFMGMASWSLVEIDKESKDGFERTTTYKGNKAFEKCRKGGRCEFSLFVGNRFLVSAKGRGNDLTIDDLHDLIDEIGVRKLESMKDEEG